MLVCYGNAWEFTAMRPCTVCLSLEEVELCMGQSGHPMEASDHKNQHCHTDAHKVPAAGAAAISTRRMHGVMKA